MGAWGYNFDDNDDYHDTVHRYVHPLIEALTAVGDRVVQLQTEAEAPLDPDSQSSATEAVAELVMDDLRPRMMATFQMVSALGKGDSIILEEDQLGTISSAVNTVRAAIPTRAPEWREPRQFVDAVERELGMIEEWMASFRQIGTGYRSNNTEGSRAEMDTPQEPYRVTVELFMARNAAGDSVVGSFQLGQVPEEGDLVQLYGARFLVKKRCWNLQHRRTVTVYVTPITHQHEAT